jgi:GGDEF domain-containing protein
VTGLPDQVLVDERLDSLLGQHHWALLTLQAAGLDAFADRYGFVARDDALRALALLMNNSVSEGQADLDNSFVGQLSDSSFMIVVEAGRAHDVANRLAARIKQSAHFFYPAKEPLSADERPELTFMLGVITAESGPYADAEALKAAGLQSLQPVW